MAAPQQQSGQPDNSAAILWIVAAIFVVGGALWITFKKQIIHAYFAVKLWEIDVISLFTANLNDVSTYILTMDPAKLTYVDVLKVGEAVGDYLRLPFVIIIIVLAFTVYFVNSTRVFKRVYTMRDLAQLEKKNWPQITPVADLDLISMDIDKGAWAMAMTPMQFCKRHHLLDEHARQRQEGMTRKEWNRIEVTLKRGQANRLFVVQLGVLWQGTQQLPMHIKAIFAAFAARINGDSKAAMDLLMRVAASSAAKLDFSGVDELCQKYENTKLVQNILHTHSYVLTVMAGMLEGAREDGVQASADFLWLKPVDRRLWYMLNSVGRQTPFVEVGGPFAHWKAEKELGRGLLVPMIEEATHALEISLKEILYKPDEVT